MATKRSAAYRAIRPRVIGLRPRDSWYDDGLAFVVFNLRPAATLGVEAVKAEAIFVLDGTSGDLLAARLIEPRAAGGGLLIDDLLRCDERSIGEALCVDGSWPS